MSKTLTTIITSLVLTGCATAPQNPNIIRGVYPQGGGIYTASALGHYEHPPVKRAVLQCQKTNQEIDIISTTTQAGILSGNAYAVIIFKCK